MNQATQCVARFIRRAGYRVCGARDWSVEASKERLQALLVEGEGVVELVKHHYGLWIRHRLYILEQGARIGGSFWWAQAQSHVATFDVPMPLRERRLAVAHRWVRVFADDWRAIDSVFTSPKLAGMEFLDVIVEGQVVCLCDPRSRCVRARVPKPSPSLPLAMAAYPGADAQLTALLADIVWRLPPERIEARAFELPSANPGLVVAR